MARKLAPENRRGGIDVYHGAKNAVTGSDPQIRISPAQPGTWVHLLRRIRLVAPRQVVTQLAAQRQVAVEECRIPQVHFLCSDC